MVILTNVREVNKLRSINLNYRLLKNVSDFSVSSNNALVTILITICDNGKYHQHTVDYFMRHYVFVPNI